MALSKNILEAHVVSYLGLMELAQLQGVDAGTKGLLDESSAWHDCISCEMPELDIAPELLRPGVRQSLAGHFAVLLKANFADDAAIQISSTNDAQRLVNLVKGAQKAAVMQSPTGASCVAVATLRFPKEGLAGAMAGEETEEAPLLCAGSPVSFDISEELAAAIGAPSLALEVQFAWQRGSLLVRVQDLAAADSEAPGLGRDVDCLSEACALLVDVSARHAAFTLHQRGGACEMDGAWKLMGPGLTSANMGRAAACRALSDGIPCTICIREGRHTAVGESLAPQKYLAHALHLDHVRSA